MPRNLLAETMLSCHDCNVIEGEIHDYGCDMESCPFCGGQLITCGCQYEKLGYNHNWDLPMCGLPKDIYENGLSKKETDKWIEILEEAGRIPYILYPNICARCGKLWPDMFNVPDEEWNRYIEPCMRHEMLCKECYDYIKSVTDKAEEKRKVKELL